MSVNTVLLVILCLLMWLFGGKKGRASFISLILSLLIMFITLILINWGLSPLILTLLSSLLISSMNLFYINGYNTKTRIAFFSSCLILTGMMGLILYAVRAMHLQGMTNEALMEMDMYSLQIGTSFIYMSISVMTMSVVGAINDIAISITSSMSELMRASPHLTEKEWYQSGLSIGKDVLGSTINTLIFAMIGSQLAVFIWVTDLNYTFVQLVNTKVLVTEWVNMLMSGIGITLTIPVTTWLMARSKKRVLIDLENETC